MPLQAADPEWVNLIPGTMLVDTGWGLAEPGPTTGNYLMREGNALVVKPRDVQVRIQKAVPFREGEIEFTFEMTGPYWEFRIKERSGRYGDLGLNGAFRGRHTVQLKVEGGNITATIDGKDKSAYPDSVDFSPLSGPLTTDAILRFTMKPRTYLKIISMRMKVKE